MNERERIKELRDEAISADGVSYDDAVRARDEALDGWSRALDEREQADRVAVNAMREREALRNERDAALAEAAMLREALVKADADMCCGKSGEYHEEIGEGKRGPCPGCAAEIAVQKALASTPLAAAAAWEGK